MPKEKHSIISLQEKVALSVLQMNLSPSLTTGSCITNDNQLTLLLIKEKKIELMGQSILINEKTLGIKT